MMGHKIFFYGEIWLLIPKLSLYSFLSGALSYSVDPDEAGSTLFADSSIFILALSESQIGDCLGKLTP